MNDPTGAEGALAVFQRVGPAVRLLRQERGFSSARLAELSSTGKSQLSKYENGKELPKLESLARILDALAVEPLMFFYWVGRLARGVSEKDMGEDLLRAEARRSPGSQPFETLFVAALQAHEAYVEARMEWRLPSSAGEDRAATCRRSEGTEERA